MADKKYSSPHARWFIGNEASAKWLTHADNGTSITTPQK